jgi:hypothetical protein
VRLHRARRRLAQLLDAGDDEDAAQRAVVDARPVNSVGSGNPGASGREEDS